MNKAALAQAIAEKVGVTKKEAEEMVHTLVEIIIEELVNDRSVTIAGFGAFSSRVRAGRIGVNPQKPEEKIPVNPVKVAKFKPGKRLKDTLKASGKNAQ